MSWATSEDLYERYGDEFINKLAIRRIWNPLIEDYIADETPQGISAVIELALSDAKIFLLQKISCKFGNVDLINTLEFSAILLWHIRLTIDTLKVGGSCFKCTECIQEFDMCTSFCSDDGICLPKKGVLISVSEAEFCCEKCIGSSCCC